MNNLLSAGFSRLKRNRFFLLTLLLVFGLSLASIWSECGKADTTDLEVSLDNVFFAMVPYMGVFYAVVISLFLGTEYSDGTIRNKIVVGHTRISIYLSNYLTCFTACLMIAAVWLIGSLPGLFLMGPFQMGTRELLLYFLVIVGFTSVFSALFTMLSMLSANKAVVVVVEIGLWVALIVLASGLIDRLGEPEQSGGMAYLNGQMVMLPREPNPLYLSGTVRTLCQCVVDALPTGQALLMHDASITAPVRHILFSLVLTVVLLAAGIGAFRKKDLK